MRYHKNLISRTEISNKNLMFGITMTVLASTWIISQLLQHKTINGFDWGFFVILVFYGMLMALKGFGYSVTSLLGKAFVSVNEESITIKVSAFAPVCTANWNDIECIEYKPTRFRLTKYNSPEQRLCMRELDADTVNELRTQVEKLATQKSIPYHTNIRQNKLSS